MIDRSILLQSIPNFRDLGGLRSTDGRTTKCGMLYRSEGPRLLSQEDAARLRELEFAVICDLRSERERTAYPNNWCKGTTATILNAPVYADLQASEIPPLTIKPAAATTVAMQVQQLMIKNYQAKPRASAPYLRTVFDMMIDNSRLPMLIHCTAGKDRTGFVVAIILLAIGIPEASVIADYEYTRERIGKRFLDVHIAAFERSFGFVPNEESIAWMNSVDPDLLRAALDSAAAEFGSIDRYIEEAVGLHPPRREKLAALLLE